jgi:hypothetical protein
VSIDACLPNFLVVVAGAGGTASTKEAGLLSISLSFVTADMTLSYCDKEGWRGERE